MFCFARGEGINQWSALRADPTSRKLEPIYKLARTYFITNY